MPEQSTAKVCVLGEALVDLIVPAAGETLEEAAHLIPRAGGAPANVAVQLARLGVEVQLLTLVGQDPMGTRLLADLTREGVDVRHVRRHPSRKTGLTMIQIDTNGERYFFPWRVSSADQAMGPDDVNPDVIAAAAFLHHGTVTLSTRAGRQAVARAVSVAKGAGITVSLDVNLRYKMFESRAELLRLALDAVRNAQLVKATDDEARALLGATDDDTATSDDPYALAEALLKQGPQLVCMTCAERGALLATRTARAFVEAPRVALKDATGAGDAFVGAVLAALCRQPRALDALDQTALRALGEAGCAAGAAAVTALGATTAMVRRG